MSRHRHKARHTDRLRERPDGEQCGKVRHISRGSAKNHARGLKSREGYVGETYWCKTCRAWHVGSRKLFIGHNRKIKEQKRAVQGDRAD